MHLTAVPLEGWGVGVFTTNPHLSLREDKSRGSDNVTQRAPLLKSALNTKQRTCGLNFQRGVPSVDTSVNALNETEWGWAPMGTWWCWDWGHSRQADVSATGLATPVNLPVCMGTQDAAHMVGVYLQRAETLYYKESQGFDV